MEQALAGRESYGKDKKRDWESYPSLLTYETEDSQITAVQPRNLDELKNSPDYLLPVPSNIRQMKQSNLPVIAHWQSCLRSFCLSLFDQGYQVVALIRRDGLHHDYVLEEAP